MHQLIPNSGMEDLLEGKGPERHSAKAHRCVDKVGAKGHDESSSWAICTSSIGKRGVYAKGHGGNANPKKKTRESGPVEPLDHPLFEANDCHAPAGSSKGGQFCGDGSSGGSGAPYPRRRNGNSPAFQRYRRDLAKWADEGGKYAGGDDWPGPRGGVTQGL